jgi:hypothetical protein
MKKADTKEIKRGKRAVTDTVATESRKLIWAAPWQNQPNGFATSMDPDQPAHPCSLIRIHAVRYQFLYLL